jgi:hypothetical protein
MNKFTIIGTEGAASGVTLEAQFNPKEISIDKLVPWQQQKTNGPGDLEFTFGSPQRMSCELMFDGFESGASIQDTIDKLHVMSNIDPGLKRPPKVQVVWGADGTPGTIPTFDAVIESVGVKYTMFDGNGLPLRATVQIGFTQARKLRVGKPQ